ncbi:MAG: HigA family addiction module antidote protein [Puniceicoccales bacterium]|jgi:addiction module HigA family antidote|nr:HigA family addiction module antidote protein [Puniceicoccales bacterium]
MAYTHFNHPGRILQEEYFDELNITQTAASKATGIPQSTLSEICSGKRDITAETALRLGKFLDTDPRMFINLQAHYDLEEAKAAFAARRPRIQIKPWPATYQATLRSAPANT